MIFAKPWADALIVLIVVLLFFGPKRLPQLGRSLGQGMREFKDSITGNSTDDPETEHPALNEGSAPAPPPSAGASSPAPGGAASGSPAGEPESARVASSEPRA